MNYTKTLLLIFFLSCFCATAQKETAQWRFGNQAGLDFQNGAPVTVSTNVAPFGYSYSSISDSAGNLLFYMFSSSTIYTKNNGFMANGQNVNGNPTFAAGMQASVIIRKGGSEYYVVTHNNMNYSSSPTFSPMASYAIVDMSLAAGMGSVISSGNPISAVGFPLVGKMAATRHCNKNDHWLLFHQGGFPGTTNYYSYLLTSTGVNNSPVVSSLGSAQPQTYTPAEGLYYGVHKFSPNGRKVAATMPYRTVELYDFDNTTGVLSNALKLDSVANPPDAIGSDDPGAWGLEFSPDGTKLYVTYVGHPFLCQFDLSAGSPSAIVNSKTIISYDTLPPGGYFLPLQLALDGKIYVSTPSSPSLAVVNNPNAMGLACNYQATGIPLGPSTVYPYVATAGWGLPNFESQFFEQKPELAPVSSSIVCGLVNFTAPVLSASAGYSVNTYEWNFNDPSSGTNTTNLLNPNHVFSSNGTYTPQLVLHYHPCGTDTLRQVVNITGLPNFTVSGKSKICKGEKSILTTSGVNTYSLNGLSTVQSTVQVQPTITTTYTISTTNTVTGCSSLKIYKVSVEPCTGMEFTEEDTFRLKLYPNPGFDSFTLESDVAMANISVYNQLGSLVYQTNKSSNIHHLDLSEQPCGIYFVEARNNDYVKTLKLVKH